jgi:hypothetical protein
VRSCGCVGVEAATLAKIKPVVRYLSLHGRIRKHRGRAAEYACVDCGKTAREWSYDGGDPEEMVETLRGMLLRYTLNISAYSPRCTSCHRRHDHQARVTAQDREDYPL